MLTICTSLEFNPLVHLLMQLFDRRTHSSITLVLTVALTNMGEYLPCIPLMASFFNVFNSLILMNSPSIHVLFSLNFLFFFCCCCCVVEEVKLYLQLRFRKELNDFCFLPFGMNLVTKIQVPKMKGKANQLS